MRFFSDFYAKKALSQERRHRFRIGFSNTFCLSDTFLQIAFGMDFGSKNLPKTTPKRGQNPSKIHAENVLIFDIVLFRVLASILEPLGPPSWSYVGSKSFPKVFPQLPWSLLKLDAFLKWRLGGFRARFWRPRASILEGSGTIFSKFSHVFGHVCRELAENLSRTCGRRPSIAKLLWPPHVGPRSSEGGGAAVVPPRGFAIKSAASQRECWACQILGAVIELYLLWPVQDFQPEF